jgi:hypothetical protein
MTKARYEPTKTIRNPNISTEFQEEGGARHPRDVLDRDPKRDRAGGTIPDNYNPETMTRVGEEADKGAGKKGATKSGS